MKMKEAIEKLKVEALAKYNAVNSWSEFEPWLMTCETKGVTRGVGEPLSGELTAVVRDYMTAHADDIRRQFLREMRADLLDAGVMYSAIDDIRSMEDNRRKAEVSAAPAPAPECELVDGKIIRKDDPRLNLTPESTPIPEGLF